MESVKRSTKINSEDLKARGKNVERSGCSPCHNVSKRTVKDLEALSRREFPSQLTQLKGGRGAHFGEFGRSQADPMSPED